MTTIRINPNKETTEKVRQALKENDGYCPCALEKTKDTKCICKDFLEKVRNGYIGFCHCELYEAVRQI